MSRVCSDLWSLLSLAIYTVSLDPSQIQVYPENGGVSGVFIVMPKNKIYSFNATTARDVCESLSTHIATRAEVQLANSNGLQTCRYGWVKEQVAVIPRTEEHQKCGQNRVGVIAWAASPSASFDVFCFNSTGQTETVTVIIPKSTNPTVKSPQAKTTSPSLMLSTLLNKSYPNPNPNPNPNPPSRSAPPVTSGFSTSTVSIVLLSTFRSLSTRSSPSLPHTSHQYQHSTSPSMTFSSPVPSSHPFTHASSLTSSSYRTEVPTQPPTLRRSLTGEVPIACVTVAVILLMAVTAGTCYFKMKRSHRLPPWVRMRHKDTADTEMWKHPDLQYPSKEQDSNCDEMTLQTEEDAESS